MTQAAVFLLLRIFSALLLLAFLGLLFWGLYQDIKVARLGAFGQFQRFGSLRVLSNPSENPAIDTIFPLSPITTFGRNDRNTIVLDDSYVSGEHALLAWRDSQWWLEDLGSRNGTLLNEAPIQGQVVLSPGDVISVGEVKFKLEG